MTRSLEYVGGKLQPAAPVRVEMSKAIDGALEMLVTLVEADAMTCAEDWDKLVQALIGAIDEELSHLDREVADLTNAAPSGGVASVTAIQMERKTVLKALRNRSVVLLEASLSPKTGFR